MHGEEIPVRSPVTRPLPVIRNDEGDLRAMKRALASAPLGPVATLALSSAIIAIEADLARARATQPTTR